MNLTLKGKELNEKIKFLKKIKVNPDNWEIYYTDPQSKEKWMKKYLESELHGGGAPILCKVDMFPWE